MTGQEELNNLTEAVKKIKPLTPQQIEEMQKRAQESPEIKGLKKEIGQLKAIENALTGGRRK